ncbi:MAG TPA: PhnD/SsuA/transferrin family substrate-binding protein [Azospira sp.]|nr:PhnD/SsuA/transferrin family substrate-binding protein [Accumulibacter sp.]HNJ75277.1 PhnD/SsuA/transferrin family substrate-binding protein [Azospira sp.]HNN07612.1 PhnD/SsuA/transferrin family substrate-binding protein [Azospira sp.]HNN44670.1 PhnD/SsuA/transferrin family substrate-binding protein [Azospira sp.]
MPLLPTLLRRALGGTLAVAAVFASALAPTPAIAAEKIQKLTLSGPFAAVSYPLIHMAESGALKDVAETVEFVPWKDPDQLRVLAIDGKGKVDFVAMPSNVAANLYNRGVKLQLVNISTWGVLWLVSRDKSLKTLEDFKDKEVLMPFRADMPDIVFQTLADKAGLDPKKNFRLRYVGTPLDAMQLLISRQADHALLSEPAVSMALRKTKSFPVSVIAPDLYRSVDLQQEWGRLLKREARIPQAGIAAMGQALTDPALVERFQQAYAASLKWCEAKPAECGAMVAKRVEMLTPEGAADSVRADNTAFVTAQEAKPELEFFFGQLHARQPALVGGKLPDAGFYYAPRK